MPNRQHPKGGDATNVILITTDAHRRNAYGFEGGTVHTPHLDQLAASGVRFTSCTATHALCQPARASILTGLYPLSNGVSDNGIDLTPTTAQNGFAAEFSRAGYFTGFVGKAHFASRLTFVPTGTPGNEHPESMHVKDWHGPYMGFEHVELAVQGHNLGSPNPPPLGQHYEDWYYRDGLGALKNELHQRRLPPDIGAPLTWNSALPPAWHNATWVTERSIDLLRRNSHRPVCMWVSFADPHPPFDCPAPWCYLHDPDLIELPKHRQLDLDRRPWWHAQAMRDPTRIFDDPRIPDSKQHSGFTRKAPESDAMLRHMLANYYGTVSLIDHGVGRIVNVLHELGMAENTLLIVTADHGFLMGEHGLLLQNPMLYDPLIQVALVLAGPGLPQGKIVEQPASTIDLRTTMLDYCGIAADGDHGQSLRGLIDDDVASRGYAYIEWDLSAGRYCIDRDLRLRMIRTRSHKLTIELNSGVGELYDLGNDPDEMTNLFDDTANDRVRRDLMALMAQRPADQLQPAQTRVGYY